MWLLSAAEVHSVNIDQTVTDCQRHAKDLLAADVTLFASLLNKQSPNHDAPAVGPSAHTEVDNIHKVSTLHTFTPVSVIPFKWGNVPGEIFCQDITKAYERQM